MSFSWFCFAHINDLILLHYGDVIMSTMASQITSVSIVYSTVCSGPDQRKHQSSASLAFVREIHRWWVNSPHKWPVTPKLFPFDDVIMSICFTQRFASVIKRTIRALLCFAMVSCASNLFMMTSSNGNIFRVTGHLCGEFTGPRWIPRTKASDAELWCFLWCAPE